MRWWWVASQDASVAGAFEMVLCGLAGKPCAAVAFLMRGKARTVKVCLSIPLEVIMGEAEASRSITGSYTAQTQLGGSSIVNVYTNLDKVTQADFDNIQDTAKALLGLANSYYVNAREQSQRSFWFALIVAGIGLCFLITAYFFSDKAILGLGSGALLEFLSAIIFTLYGRTSSQLSAFHTSMDRMQRFIVAYSMTEGLEGEVKQKARADLVKTVSTVGMEVLAQQEVSKK